MIPVGDTGAGRPPDVLSRVFEPFFTTKEVGKGSGLGLPQVLGVAKQLGGGVTISSAPGQGTSVRVYLARAAEMAVPQPQTAPGPAPGSLGISVLLVDDDADVRAALSGMLHDLGCRTVEAASGMAGRAQVWPAAHFHVL